MTIQEIKKTIRERNKEGNYAQATYEQLSLEIDKLSHPDRIVLREELGNIPLPRNLFFDYKTQQWID